MYFYFSCEYPAALKLNGIYYGIISDTVKACNIDLSAPTLAEVCSLIPDERGINFIIDDNFDGILEGCSVTDLKGGYLIKFNRNHRGGEFKVMAQEKFPDLCATVFNDNGLKISLETPKDFFADNLSVFCETAEIRRFTVNGTDFCVSIIRAEKTVLFVYSLTDKISKVFERQVDEYSFDNGFYTTENFCDIAKHRVTCCWNFDNGAFCEKERNIQRSENFSADNLPEKLLPFAFLEELLIGGDISAYLCDGIKENADKLGGYLGNFIGIMPPPIFRSIDEVGLIYKYKDNRYRVDYVTFEFSNGKISNIKKTT